MIALIPFRLVVFELLRLLARELLGVFLECDPCLHDRSDRTDAKRNARSTFEG